ALIVAAEIGAVVWVKTLGQDVATSAPSMMGEGYNNTAALGELIYTKYLYPFELAAVLLLVAIVAAITLTMRKRPGLKQQDVAAQVAVRASDRVRIVKMATVKDEPAPADDSQNGSPS